jgi:hypothetical protein
VGRKFLILLIGLPQINQVSSLIHRDEYRYFERQVCLDRSHPLPSSMGSKQAPNIHLQTVSSIRPISTTCLQPNSPTFAIRSDVPAHPRAFRVGIDASIWFVHAEYGKEGENPELRTIFFRLTKLLQVCGPRLFPLVVICLLMSTTYATHLYHIIGSFPPIVRLRRPSASRDETRQAD